MVNLNVSDLMMRSAARTAKEEAEKAAAERNKPAESQVTVYDIQPYFDSYVVDMERNIELDPETWERYENDPAPFLNDLICDFHVGEWKEEEIRAAVRRYTGDQS